MTLIYNDTYDYNTNIRIYRASGGILHAEAYKGTRMILKLTGDCYSLLKIEIEDAVVDYHKEMDDLLESLEKDNV